jgi:threonine dehydratase
MSSTEVEIDLEMRGDDHVTEVLEALESAGYEIEVLEGGEDAGTNMLP